MGYTPVLLASNLPYIRLDPSWVGDFPLPETNEERYRRRRDQWQDGRAVGSGRWWEHYPWPQRCPMLTHTIFFFGGVWGEIMPWFLVWHEFVMDLRCLAGNCMKLPLFQNVPRIDGQQKCRKISLSRRCFLKPVHWMTAFLEQFPRVFFFSSQS